MDNMDKDMNQDKNKNRNQIILSILGIIALVVVTAGVSYAFFTYAKEGTTINTISTGTLKFLFTENDNAGNGIRIENALPISDAQGLVQTGEGNIFDFTIDSTTEGASAINYEVNAIKQSSSTLPDEVVKVALADTTSGTEVFGGEGNLTKTTGILFSELDQTTTSGANGKKLYTGVVNANTKNYVKTFRLRMWLDESADFSPEEDSTTGEGKYNGKVFSLKINVYANANVISSGL